MREQQLIPININEIPYNPENKKILIKEIGNRKVKLYIIQKDIFKNQREMEIPLLVQDAEFNEIKEYFFDLTKKVDHKKTMQAIDKREKIWKDCLKKAKNDYKKAYKLFNKAYKG
jgi:hypothetical protein